MIFSIAITGPTASGKTGLSLKLAELLSGEIISADSMQIYKGMDVGTAKATKEERALVPHHLIDFLSPTENYSVECYRAGAIAAARDIESRGRLPILVGGTGLYVSSLLRAEQSEAPESDPQYRAAILDGIRSEGDVHALWERLRAVDPDSAEKIHENNFKRVIRALEIYERTGITKTELDRRSRIPSPEIFVGMITLDFHNRDVLYGRIDQRVDQMMDEGLLSEVEALYSANLLPPDSTAAQAIGYKEIIEYLRGECSLSDAVEKIKLSTRRYAKRQLTWFRRTEGACTIFMDDEQGKMRSLQSVLDEAVNAVSRFRDEFSTPVQTG